jgi:catechol 2,3-dioxygenase-like lactoylglutathione lyase family enzyme
MHRSQLGGLIIDCQTDDLDAAADFWSAALGMKRVKHPKDEPSPEKYVHLKHKANDLDIEVQQVDHPSRVHIDIETDDIKAEVARLVKLGAKKVKKIDGWWVMEAPTGQRFCVVHAGRSRFKQEANVWK